MTGQVPAAAATSVVRYPVTHDCSIPVTNGKLYGDYIEAYGIRTKYTRNVVYLARYYYHVRSGKPTFSYKHFSLFAKSFATFEVAEAIAP